MAKRRSSEDLLDEMLRILKEEKNDDNFKKPDSSNDSKKIVHDKILWKCRLCDNIYDSQVNLQHHEQFNHSKKFAAAAPPKRKKFILKITEENKLTVIHHHRSKNRISKNTSTAFFLCV